MDKRKFRSMGLLVLDESNHLIADLRAQEPVSVSECWIGWDDSLTFNDQLYNVELFAAASDLLEALKAYQDANRVRNDSEAELYELAEAAIARAEGKAE